MRTGRRDWLWAVAIIVLVGAGIAAMVIAFVGSSDSGPEPDEPAISGIECNRGEHTTYHVHAQVSIYLEGELLPIPNNVGLIPTESRDQLECLYWLHTHDTAKTGIHVEAPRQDNYTLGQFFAIWNQPLSSTQLLDRTTDAEHRIEAIVNGEPYTGDPAQIPLADNSVIILEYGPPFKEG